MKLVVLKPGPLTEVGLVRYTVINGEEGPHVQIPLRLMNVRQDTFYRVRLDVRGHDFTTTVQGQVVDTWSDERLRQGGVGFFCDKDEQALLRWVEISHQYDALGRLCAYLAPSALAPYNTQTK